MHTDCSMYHTPPSFPIFSVMFQEVHSSRAA